MSNARKIAEFASTLGRKNLLINGSMRVWQRGSSGSLPLNEWTYTADRWVSDCYGAALSWAQGSTPTNSNNTAGSLVISGAASNTGFSVHQRIEAANSFFTYGKKLTVSGQLYKSGTASAIDLFLHRPTAKDNFGTTVAIGNKGTINHPGGGAWIEFSHTFDTACPIEVANGLALIISHTSLGSGVDVGFTNVQLEIGEEATEFEWCPYSDEVVQCPVLRGRKRTTILFRWYPNWRHCRLWKYGVQGREKGYPRGGGLWMELLFLRNGYVIHANVWWKSDDANLDGFRTY